MSSLKGGFITRSKSRSVSKPTRTGNKKSSSHQRKTKKMGLWGGSPTKGSKGSTGSNSTSSSAKERHHRNPKKKQNKWRELFLQHVAANQSVSPLSSLESEYSPPKRTEWTGKPLSKFAFTNAYCRKKGISMDGQALQDPDILNQIDVAFKKYEKTDYVPW